MKHLIWVLCVVTPISCAIKTKLLAKADAKENLSASLTSPSVLRAPLYPTFQIKRQDTTKRRERKEFQDRVDKFLARSDKAYGHIEEIFAINLEWQKRYMRVADTARARKQGKDSISIILNAVRDSVRESNRLQKAVLVKYDKYKASLEQNRRYSQFVDWQFWAGFFIIMVVLIANLIYSKKILRTKANLYL